MCIRRQSDTTAAAIARRTDRREHRRSVSTLRLAGAPDSIECSSSVNRRAILDSCEARPIAFRTQVRVMPSRTDAQIDAALKQIQPTAHGSG
jgi:hypothetical protein